MIPKIDLYKAIGRSLRAGVLLACLLCVIGLMLWAAAGYPAQILITASNILTVLQLATSANFSGIIYLGILVLIATPVFRVIVSAIGFSVEKDRQFLIISLTVLGMLLIGILSGSVA